MSMPHYLSGLYAGQNSQPRRDAGLFNISYDKIIHDDEKKQTCACSKFTMACLPQTLPMPHELEITEAWHSIGHIYIISIELL